MTSKIAYQRQEYLAQNVNTTGPKSPVNVNGLSVGHVQVEGAGNVSLQGSIDGVNFHTLHVTLADGTLGQAFTAPTIVRIQLFGLNSLRLQVNSVTSPITAILSALS